MIFVVFTIKKDKVRMMLIKNFNEGAVPTRDCRKMDVVAKFTWQNAELMR